MDYRGLNNLPRGLRNNNPFNLKEVGIAWLGKVPGQDSVFTTFESVRYGIRAGLLDLFNDYTRKGHRTIRSLISEFAPPSENDTAAYIDFVSKTVGIGPDRLLLVSDLVPIAQAIVMLENGPSSLTSNVARYVPQVASSLEQYKDFVSVPDPARAARLLLGLGFVIWGL
jgi:hypothetical protein